jgi:hypothetical protein
LENELQENLTVSLCSGYDRRRQLVPVCLRACVIGQVGKLVKTAVYRDWPGETGLFGHSRACPEVCPKVYASVFVLQAFRHRRVFHILTS